MSISRPASRQELIEYCLRRLGHPVLEINIDPVQIEDRVEEALEFYREHNFNSNEMIYLAEQVTANVIAQGYFTVSDAVIGINRVFPLTSRTRGIDMFDVRYQLLLNDLYSLQSIDMLYYTQVQTHLQLINDILVGEKPIRFNRHMNRVYVDTLNTNNVGVNEFMIFECYRILDPDEFTDVYNDYFLKKYLTALLKMQWGTNLKKFEGMQLPGGVTMNGQKIYDEAVAELDKLSEEARSTYELPIDFFVK